MLGDEVSADAAERLHGSLDVLGGRGELWWIVASGETRDCPLKEGPRNQDVSAPFADFAR